MTDVEVGVIIVILILIDEVHHFLVSSFTLLDIHLLTPIIDSIFEGGVGTYITKNNLLPYSIYFAVRHIPEHTWLNDRDQFLYPNNNWQADTDFKNNCLIYTLFDNQNFITSSSDKENNWIPFYEQEIQTQDVMASHFMADFLHGKIKPGNPTCGTLFANNNNNAPVVPSKSIIDNLTPEAKAVMDAGRELFKFYHQQQHANPNASYYDIRKHFQGVTVKDDGSEKMNPKSDNPEYNRLIKALRDAHKKLGEAILPKIYDYGFLIK